jgi:hypothetical protein
VTLANLTHVAGQDANTMINGTAWWNQAADRVVARLVVRPRTGPAVRLTARWRPFGAQAQLASITGEQAGQHLVAVAPAP